MSTFEDVLAEIEKMENGTEKVAAIKLRLSKVNTESQSLRKKMKKTEEKANKYDGLVLSFENTDFNLEGDISEQLEAFSKNQNENKAKSSKMEKDFVKMQSRLNVMEEENVKLANSKKKTAIKDRLSKNFNETISNGGLVLDHRIANGIFFVNDNNKVAYNRGDEEITENIFETYSKDHKGEVRVQHKKGPGGKPYTSNNNPGGYSEDQLKNMTMAEYNALDDDEKKGVQESANHLN